jgi:hypothetical protein
MLHGFSPPLRLRLARLQTVLFGKT